MLPTHLDDDDNDECYDDDDDDDVSDIKERDKYQE